MLAAGRLGEDSLSNVDHHQTGTTVTVEQVLVMEEMTMNQPSIADAGPAKDDGSSCGKPTTRISTFIGWSPSMLSPT